jgi:hypothetical protein
MRYDVWYGLPDAEGACPMSDFSCLLILGPAGWSVLHSDRLDHSGTGCCACNPLRRLAAIGTGRATAARLPMTLTWSLSLRLAGGSHNPALPERQYTWYPHSGLLCPSETRSQVITPWLAQSVTEGGPGPSSLSAGARHWQSAYFTWIHTLNREHTRALAARAMKMRFDAIAKKIK